VSPKNEKPLVSLIVVAYQQEKYIREAVRSALEQTYEPLEIVLSDDVSSDKTYEIMEEEAKRYQGPHTIVLNRNATNIGLVRHVEHAVSISHGDFIISQAGDDISLPRRAELLVAAWKNPTPVDMVCSDVLVIDEAGVVIQEGWHSPIIDPLSLDEAVSKGNCYALGCATGYSRSVFDDFLPMTETVYQEDNVLPFRAWVRNGARAIPDKLVEYRKHSDNIFHGKETKQDKKRFIRHIKNSWGIAYDRLAAWDLCKKPDDERRNALVRQERYYWYRSATVDSNFMGTLKLAKKGLGDGLSTRNALGLIKLYFSLQLTS
jgi:glycosyltransferase involved in cell wall biosynthesis